MKIRRENGIDKKSMGFQLQDINGKQLPCNMWGEHAMKLQGFIDTNKHTSEHIVIWIQNAKFKDWNRLPQVTNHLNGARLHINSEVSPIVTFKKELLDRDDFNYAPTQISDLAHDAVIKSAVDDYTRDVFKSVDQVRSTEIVSYCVVKVTVTKFLLDEGWFTYSCKTCNKKGKRSDVDCSDERIFDCKDCGRVKEFTGKLRVVVRVHDLTGSMSLVMFDSQCQSC